MGEIAHQQHHHQLHPARLVGEIQHRQGRPQQRHQAGEQRLAEYHLQACLVAAEIARHDLRIRQRLQLAQPQILRRQAEVAHPQIIQRHRHLPRREGDLRFLRHRRGGQHPARTVRVGAPIAAVFQRPAIMAKRPGHRCGIDLRQMAFAVQLVDGHIVQLQRRAIFDLGPQQAVGQGDPVIAAALAAVQANAFAAQLLGDLHVNGGRPQPGIHAKQHHAHHHTCQQRGHQAEYRRAAAVPDQQPLARLGEGALAPHHAQEGGKGQKGRQQIGQPQRRQLRDASDHRQRTAAEQRDLRPQIDGQGNGDQGRRHHHGVAQIGTRHIARVQPPGRQIDGACAAFAHARASCGRTKSLCRHTIRAKVPAAIAP